MSNHARFFLYRTPRPVTGPVLAWRVAFAWRAAA